MEYQGDEEYQLAQYCFPQLNTSCTKISRSKSAYIIMYLFFSSVSMLVVFLNLLVIISISHFKQLHTPTNLLILSLAVADLLVGIIVIPVESIKFVESCWHFGQFFCFVFQLIVYTVISASLSILLCIAVDRYAAVCHPLLYSSFVTVGKTIFFICLSWSCSLSYNLILLYSNKFSNPVDSSACKGHCVLFISFKWGVVDLVFSFVFPTTVMITLYLNIFKVARYQAQAIQSRNAGSVSLAAVSGPKRSERKAAKTLAIVVAVYLLCWIPYYISLLTENNTKSIVTSFLTWVLYTNSCVNPLIYALFYPWFKTSVKHILTLRVLDKSSSLMCLHPDIV